MVVFNRDGSRNKKVRNHGVAIILSIVMSSSSLSLEERIANLEANRDREETARDEALAIGDLVTANACRVEIGGFTNLLAELKAEARQARPGNNHPIFFHSLYMF